MKHGSISAANKYAMWILVKKKKNYSNYSSRLIPEENVLLSAHHMIPEY